MHLLYKIFITYFLFIYKISAYIAGSTEQRYSMSLRMFLFVASDLMI